MAGASIVALLLRTVVSLGVVLAIVAIAYWVAKHRNGGQRMTQMATRRGSTRRTTRPGLEVVGRVGLTRGSAVVALRFGGRVMLVAAGEQGSSSVLGTMPAAEWDELHTIRQPLADVVAGSAAPSNSGAFDLPRPSFIDALRQATARHA